VKRAFSGKVAFRFSVRKCDNAKRAFSGKVAFRFSVRKCGNVKRAFSGRACPGLNGVGLQVFRRKCDESRYPSREFP
jgi:hypothetical protein